MKKDSIKKVVIAMGSNMGDREKYIEEALSLIDQDAGRVIAKSSIIETAAYGYTEQDDFLNLAILIETTLEPLPLLRELQRIEKDLDRVRLIHWGPRTIDLDIIYYEDRIIDEPELKVPHPDRLNRGFVMGPISEILPDFKDPETGTPISDLARAL